MRTVVPLDSPNRCQAIDKLGSQCFYAQVEGTPFCHLHKIASSKKVEAEKIRNYNFTRYRDRINGKADSEVIKSLREEIGVLRLLMEDTINRCTNDVDLLIYSPKIMDLTTKIEKLVVSCHKLETSLGNTLDKTALLNVSTRLINVISTHINDENVINNIVDEIGKMISEA